ncbi:MAG: glycosyltransferase WbuB, partial [Acidobacteria bacterium]|nr:glycosyltransferase WbuB [Acidobacteriota bacterium]
MRILFVTQIFPPEMGALPNRLYPFVRQLVAAGHTVSVATGMPNYPRGVVFPEYRGHRSIREEVNGCTVFR